MGIKEGISDKLWDNAYLNEAVHGLEEGFSDADHSEEL